MQTESIIMHVRYVYISITFTISVHRNVNRYFSSVLMLLKAFPEVFSISIIYVSSYYRSCTRAFPFWA